MALSALTPQHWDTEGLAATLEGDSGARTGLDPCRCFLALLSFLLTSSSLRRVNYFISFMVKTQLWWCFRCAVLKVVGSWYAGVGVKASAPLQLVPFPSCGSPAQPAQGVRDGQ